MNYEFAKSQERKQTSFSGLRKSAEPLAVILYKMPYKEVNLTGNTDDKSFEEFKERIINVFKAESINDIQMPYFRYFDFKIQNDKLTLHKENFCGISIFPTNLENATKSENDSVEYYALKLLCSDNLYANFVTLQDGAKMRIDILLDNILNVRSDKGKFEFINRNSKNIKYELCNICDGSFDEYWESEDNYVCINCFKEFINDYKYFEKLRNMNREEILDF